MESHPVQTACCLSIVLDGIAMSAKTSAKSLGVQGRRALREPCFKYSQF